MGMNGKRSDSLVDQGSQGLTGVTCGKALISRLYKIIVFGIVIVTLLAAPQSSWADTKLTEVGVEKYPEAVAVNSETNKIYVANSGSNTVTVIDGEDNKTETVNTGPTPTALAVNPSTNKIYVVTRGQGGVTVIDGKNNESKLVSTESIPRAVAVNPVTNKIYVANRSSNTVTVINSIDDTIMTTVFTGMGSEPTAIAVNTVTNKIYVANSGSDNVTVIDGKDNKPTTTVSTGTGSKPDALVVNTETNKIYVTSSAFGSNGVTVIDGSDDTMMTTVFTGGHHIALAVNTGTNKIYAVSQPANNVTVIDGTNDTIKTTVATPSGPKAVAVNPETNKIYVANYSSNNVTVIDGTSNTTTHVTTGKWSSAVAVNPETNRIYVANSGQDDVTVIDGEDNSTISPQSASFDKKSGAATNTDVTTTMMLNEHTLTSIANGEAPLKLGTDYTVADNKKVTILKTYLASQSVGTTNLTFTFSGGIAQTLAITVSDTTPGNSTISPLIASFDKKSGAATNTDVTTTMTLNGNTLTSIANGATPLKLGTDYTVTDNKVTILKTYLASRSVGTTSLTFTFSGGATQTLSIKVSDTTPPTTPTPTPTPTPEPGPGPGPGSAPTPTPTPKPTSKPTPTPTPTPFYIDEVNMDVIKAMVAQSNAAPAVSFKDVPANAPDAKAIILATKLGIIKGYEDGSFRADATITRAEFASLLVRTLGLKSEGDTGFIDTKGHWAADAIATLKTIGIANGYLDGTFKPNQTITRAEIVAMLSKVMNNTNFVKNTKFKDVVGHWAEAKIGTLSDMGIAKGMPDGLFKPNANATRSESLLMILRMLNASLDHSLDVE